jgi:hypothetical protein
MAGQISALDAPEWLVIDEAAKRLGKSVRSVQRLAATDLVSWNVETGTRNTRLYHADDVDRVKDERIPARRVEVKSDPSTNTSSAKLL